MKVLHVQKAKGIGGSERHLLAALPALARRGIDVRMVVLTTGDGGRFVAELEEKGITTDVLPAGPEVNPIAIGQLVAAIRRHRPNVVHTHLVHGDVHGLVAARLAGVAGVSTVHDVPAFYRRQPYRSVGRLMGRLARRRIAISDFVAAFLRELGLAPRERIEVIPYGIDAAAWALAADAGAGIRSELGIADRTVVGIASRLVPGKGHDTMLDAFARACARAEGLHLVVAGDGPLRPQLEATAARTCAPGTVTFLGFVDDVPRLMAACDVIVVPTSPTLGEGFGLAALEAMAAGRAVVASDVAALPEVVLDGVAGLVVRPDAPNELAGALVTLAGDAARRAAMGAAGAERARTVFGLDPMVSRTVAVYEAVA
jgi:glycosyltransferase involved in cell wall biosynthesis